MVSNGIGKTSFVEALAYCSGHPPSGLCVAATRYPISSLKKSTIAVRSIPPSSVALRRHRTQLLDTLVRRLLSPTSAPPYVADAVVLVVNAATGVRERSATVWSLSRPLSFLAWCL